MLMLRLAQRGNLDNQIVKIPTTGRNQTFCLTLLGTNRANLRTQLSSNSMTNSKCMGWRMYCRYCFWAQGFAELINNCSTSDLSRAEKCFCRTTRSCPPGPQIWPDNSCSLSGVCHHNITVSWRLWWRHHSIERINIETLCPKNGQRLVTKVGWNEYIPRGCMRASYPLCKQAFAMTTPSTATLCNTSISVVHELENGYFWAKASMPSSTFARFQIYFELKNFFGRGVIIFDLI